MYIRLEDFSSDECGFVHNRFGIGSIFDPETAEMVLPAHGMYSNQIPSRVSKQPRGVGVEQGWKPVPEQNKGGN
jgi:hypothetical protein